MNNIMPSNVEISTTDELRESLNTTRSVSYILLKQTVFMSVDSNHSSIVGNEAHSQNKFTHMMDIRLKVDSVM